VCPVLNTTDIKDAVIGQDAKRHSVIATPRHSPAFELKTQWLGYPVRLGWQRDRNELGNGGRDFAR
jgi:hypothetical protein